MSRRETLCLEEQTGLSLPTRLLFPDPCSFGKPALDNVFEAGCTIHYRRKLAYRGRLLLDDRGRSSRARASLTVRARP